MKPDLRTVFIEKVLEHVPPAELERAIAEALADALPPAVLERAGGVR